MKDFIFSTTRQWNCGDEFILLGTMNIIKAAVGDFNPIIYNRNPDIRPIGLSKGFRNLKFQRGYTQNKDLCLLTSYLRIGFHDNSIKYDSDLSNASMAFFAGSPETFGHRNYNFFEHIIKNNIPLMALGIGWFGNVSSFEKEIYKKALFVSVRDEELLKHDFLKDIGAIYLPCPALQSAPREKEKKITKIKKIALGLGVKLDSSVINACIDDGTYDFSVKLYENLIKRYGNVYQFSIVCHYIDEIAVAHKIFDKYGIDILYSFDSKDYIDIYRNFDLTISPRVHACGISSSLGIPNINISHDNRAGTCKGFLSDFINLKTSIEDIYAIFEKNLAVCEEKNQDILLHKHKTMERYVNLIKKHVKYEKINYNLNTNIIPYSSPIFDVNNTDTLVHLKLTLDDSNTMSYSDKNNFNKIIKILEIPFLKMERKNNVFKFFLFCKFPILKIKNSKEKKFYLFNFLPILKIR